MDNKIEVGEVFTISDESNEEQEVEVLAKVTLEDTDYVAVSFLEDLQADNEEDIDLFFLKIDVDGELTAIETDEEFDIVSEAFDEILEEE
ncbi:DUF1292 domain-containing protein [Oceanobacillus rekensis]|uniref:DUF1292 domain-containing protein n=1 Tax=Oceanobacillus rekensis TaxID=937927 RepID=UPI000B43F6FB|nr:DUF1292 domain-containing protein [Oceanobacillus rekensis]